MGMTAMVMSTVLTAGSQIAAGRNADKAARREAEQLDVNAGQVQAASQRAAQEERRRSTVVQSRALAVAGASGAGASDPTVVDIISDLAGEGAYRSALALYEGDDKARALKDDANMRRFEGKQAKTAGYIQGAATIMGGASNLYGKYNTGGGLKNWEGSALENYGLDDRYG